MSLVETNEAQCIIWLQILVSSVKKKPTKKPHNPKQTRVCQLYSKEMQSAPLKENNLINISYKIINVNYKNLCKQMNVMKENFIY